MNGERKIKGEMQSSRDMWESKDQRGQLRMFRNSWTYNDDDVYFEQLYLLNFDDYKLETIDWLLSTQQGPSKLNYWSVLSIQIKLPHKISKVRINSN